MEPEQVKVMAGQTTLEKIKVLLGFPPEPGEQDKILNIMIGDAECAVRDYCHIGAVPEELDYVVRELVLSAYRNNNGSNVSSIKRGDTQINYSETITASGFSDRQMKTLGGYRKLRMG